MGTVKRFEKKLVAPRLAVELLSFLWLYPVVRQYLGSEHLDSSDGVVPPVAKQEVIHADFPVFLDQLNELAGGREEAGLLEYVVIGQSGCRGFDLSRVAFIEVLRYQGASAQSVFRNEFLHVAVSSVEVNAFLDLRWI